MVAIHTMNLALIDLNLLVALDALIAEAHVGRAARKIGLSQPAASHALGRLRELLNDPLLVRAGARMELTPRARSLREPLAEALRRVQGVLAAESFEPARSTRRFCVMMQDHVAHLVLPPLVKRVNREGISRIPAGRVFYGHGSYGRAKRASSRGANEKPERIPEGEARCGCRKRDFGRPRGHLAARRKTRENDCTARARLRAGAASGGANGAGGVRSETAGGGDGCGVEIGDDTAADRPGRVSRVFTLPTARGERPGLHLAAKHSAGNWRANRR